MSVSELKLPDRQILWVEPTDVFVRRQLAWQGFPHFLAHLAVQVTSDTTAA